MTLRRLGTALSALVLSGTMLMTGTGQAAAVGTTSPVRHSNCTTALTASEKAQLVTASDTSTMPKFADAQPRLAVIEQIFSSHRDHRGIFAIFYKNILATAVPAVAAGQFDDNVWAERVSRNFVVAYLDNLHGYLTGGSVTKEWASYYAMASDCSRSVGRVAAQALIAHLVVDFPWAIAKANSKAANQNDFFKFGDLLIDTTTALTTDIATVYGQDLSELFGLFWFGDALDGMAGKPITTPAFFQSIRLNAWIDGLFLTQWWLVPGTKLSMDTKFAAGSAALDSMEFFKLI